MLWFVALLILALIPAFIAQSKGRNFAAWWIYGVLLWIIALPHAIFATDLKAASDAAERARKQRAEAAVIAASKTCPRCAETVKRAAIACRFCGFEFSSETVEPEGPRVSSALERVAADLEQDGRGNPSRLDAMAFGRLIEALAAVGCSAQRRGGGVAVSVEGGGTAIFYECAELAQYLRKIARNAGADAA